MAGTATARLKIACLGVTLSSSPLRSHIATVRGRCWSAMDSSLQETLSWNGSNRSSRPYQGRPQQQRRPQRRCLLESRQAADRRAAHAFSLAAEEMRVSGWSVPAPAGAL